MDQSTIWNKNLVYLHTSSESKHAFAEITECKKPAAAGAVLYLDQKGLLQYRYCLAYQYLIIAAALPPIAARCAKPGTQPEIRN